MGVTIVGVFTSNDTSVQVGDSAENIAYQLLESEEELTSTMEDLFMVASADSYILPEDFPESELGQQVYKEIEELDLEEFPENHFVAIVFLVHTDSEEPTQDEIDILASEIDKALTVGDLSLAKCSITAYYMFKIKR